LRKICFLALLTLAGTAAAEITRHPGSNQALPAPDRRNQ
jgi:hypothetical protein